MKYETIDDEICRHFRISKGHPTLSEHLLNLAKTYTKGKPLRLIDRRIQAMRKSGRISYNNHLRTWTVND